MSTVTYSNADVVQALQREFVPVQVDLETSSKLADQFQVIWTPSLNVIDARGRKVYGIEGWLPPVHFQAMLETARGQVLLRGKQFAAAADVFQGVIDRFAGTPYAAEAQYYRGVTRYLDAHQVDALKDEWGRLTREHPASEWAVRADIF